MGDPVRDRRYLPGVSEEAVPQVVPLPAPRLSEYLQNAESGGLSHWDDRFGPGDLPSCRDEERLLFYRALSAGAWGDADRVQADVWIGEAEAMRAGAAAFAQADIRISDSVLFLCYNERTNL